MAITAEKRAKRQHIGDIADVITQRDFLNEIAKKCGVNQFKCQRIYKAIIGTVQDYLLKYGEFRLQGIGKLYVEEKDSPFGKAIWLKLRASQMFKGRIRKNRGLPSSYVNWSEERKKKLGEEKKTCQESKKDNENSVPL